MSNKMWQDIIEFHEKFGLIRPDSPVLLDDQTFDFRYKFLIEELTEMKVAQDNKDLSEVFDALIDLCYVALGTAYMMGLPFNWGWDEVQRANMQKERATNESQSKRGSKLDVIKPKGWRPPDIESCLLDCGWVQQPLFEEET